MVDLSSFRLTGPNNPASQMSVTKWNALITALEGSIGASAPALPVVSITAPANIAEGTGGTTNLVAVALRTGDLSGSSSATATVTGIGANPASATDFVGDVLPTMTVTWNAGQSAPVAQPTAPIKTDATAEPNEGLRWTLSNPVSCTIGASTADTTITDDDSAVADNSTLTRSIAFEGDSLDYDYAGYYAGNYKASHPELNIISLALGGSGIGGPGDVDQDLHGWPLAYNGIDPAGKSDVPRSFWARLKAIVAIRPYIAYFGGHRNDLVGAASGQAQYTRYSALWQSAKNQLPGLRVIVVLPGAVDEVALGGGYAGYNAKAAAFNALARAAKGGGLVDEVVDFGAHAVLGTSSSTFLKSDPAVTGNQTKTADGLHYYDASGAGGTTGSDLAIPVFATAFNALVAATPLPPAGDIDVSVFSIATGPAQNEGDTGSTSFPVTISRVGGGAYPAACDYQTIGGTANALDLFAGVLPAGTVNFAANELSKSFNVLVAGETVVEPNETLVLGTLNGRTFGTSTGSATITINNDDSGVAPGIGYVIGTPDSQGGFTGQMDFINQSLPAGRMTLFVNSDYGRLPETIKVKRAGQTDINLTVLTPNNGGQSCWVGDIPSAATDYTISLVRVASALIGQIIIPIVVTGAAASHSQYFQQDYASGNSPPYISTAILTKPANGLAFKFTQIAAATTAVMANNDGSTIISTFETNNYDAQKYRSTISVLAASAQLSTSTPGNASPGISMIGIAYAPA